MNRLLVSRTLLVVALLDVLVATSFWALAGAHPGWTKTRVERVSLDEVTGLEARHWEDRFVPGVDLLGASWMGAAILAALAFFVRKPKPNNSDP